MTGYRHGWHGTKTYRAWQQAKKRCRCETDKDYPSYGGRGITFDSKWEDFTVFLSDMGEAPKGYTLGRKDNDGPYTRNNCEWQPWAKQARNKRNTLRLTINGISKPIADWADETGIDAGTIRARLRAGWSNEEATQKTGR